MEGHVVLALAIIIPAVLFPAAFVWYLNFGGIIKALREARRTTTVRTAPTK